MPRIVRTERQKAIAEGVRILNESPDAPTLVALMQCVELVEGADTVEWSKWLEASGIGDMEIVCLMILVAHPEKAVLLRDALKARKEGGGDAV